MTPSAWHSPLELTSTQVVELHLYEVMPTGQTDQGDPGTTGMARDIQGDMRWVSCRDEEPMIGINIWLGKLGGIGRFSALQWSSLQHASALSVMVTAMHVCS